VLLFITVVAQVLGLIAVLKKTLALSVVVTVINSLLFTLLIFVSNFGLLLLLLLAVADGFWFAFYLKIGLRKELKVHKRLREEVVNQVRESIVQTCNRMTPCIHVSMEQYEAMTQQML